MAERKLQLKKKENFKPLGDAGRPDGGNLVVKARVDAKKEIRVNPDYVNPEIKVKEFDNHQESFRCACCGATYKTQRGNFLSGCGSLLWRGNNNYLTICKSCVNIWFQSLTDFYSGNEEHALRHLCCMFGWYYCDLASGMAASSDHGVSSKACLYPGKAGTRPVTRRGVDYLQTIRDMYGDGTTGYGLVQETSSDKQQVGDDCGGDTSIGAESENDEDKFVVSKAMVRRWGPGFNANQYEYLEEEYDDWCEKAEVKSKSQEELVRAMCIAQLNIRVQQSTGGKVDAAMKTLTDLMTNCNLTPRQHAEMANASDEKLAYGQMIKRIENEMPIPEPQAEFKDPDGIRKYINTFFFGHLAKALGIKNDFEAEYENEMSKYAVELSDEEPLVSADDVLGVVDEPSKTNTDAAQPPGG